MGQHKNTDIATKGGTSLIDIWLSYAPESMWNDIAKCSQKYANKDWVHFSDHMKKHLYHIIKMMWVHDMGKKDQENGTSLRHLLLHGMEF